MQGETPHTELNLQSLYEEYLPAVYRVAYSYMKNSYDSEDAAQEAFLRLARGGTRFADKRQIKAWLVVTVSNVCRDMLRRRHRQDGNLDDYPELPAPQTGAGELTAALLALPDELKVPLYLYYYEGYSVREIARAMGRPEGTVKSRLHRARRLLKESLEEGTT